MVTHILCGDRIIRSSSLQGTPETFAARQLVWFENPGWQRHVIAGNFSRMINLAVIEWEHRMAIVLAAGSSSEAGNSPGPVYLLEPEGDVVREPVDSVRTLTPRPQGIGCFAIT